MSADFDARWDERERWLADNQFSGALGLGGMFGPDAASCLRCGALVVLTPEATSTHLLWHKAHDHEETP